MKARGTKAFGWLSLFATGVAAWVGLAVALGSSGVLAFLLGCLICLFGVGIFFSILGWYERRFGKYGLPPAPLGHTRIGLDNENAAASRRRRPAA